MEKNEINMEKEHMRINYAHLERKTKNLYLSYRNAFQMQVKK